MCMLCWFLGALSNFRKKMKGNAYIDQWKSERCYNGAWLLAWREKQLVYIMGHEITLNHE